jgi:hypothetical protein
MFCTKCGREIPDDATLCPYCGFTVGAAPPPVPPPQPRKGFGAGKISIIVIASVIGLIVVSCIGCIVFGNLASSSPTVQATRTARAAARATEAAKPTNTPGPTAVPLPTAIPTVPPTSTPFKYTVEAIERKRDELTDLQWNEFTKSAVGEPIRFAGEVIEVYSDERVQINDGNKILTVCILHRVPHDFALSLTKDSFVEGEGTIRKIDIFLGINVEIDVEQIE